MNPLPGAVPREFDIAVVTEKSRSDNHTVLTVSAAADSGPLTLWLSHDPGVPASATQLDDALRCHGWLAYRPDLDRWVTYDGATEVYATRSARVLELADALVARNAVTGHPLADAVGWLRRGFTVEQAIGWADAAVLYPADAAVLARLDLAPYGAEVAGGAKPVGTAPSAWPARVVRRDPRVPRSGPALPA
ncbi:hypothetical protein [Amycolatopsis suaedae]|uniref:Uncharacterized protein n=1 Tax=Amycolatopsis suaedae TaxID=2510978 RepID=A0A4Q7J3E7_9PSEU|nr:hypothetical protein [Amycolatopsis suaedae]RZQ60504.1 hypothetical protein EWH70_27870 [Amycolatopsis suaedae]